jgi:hypothetical protein
MTTKLKDFLIGDSSEAVTPAPVSIETGTVESFGEKRGFLPQWLKAAGPGGERRINPEYWKVAAAMAFKKWSLSTQVTEADFDAAVTAIAGHVHT